MAWILLCILLVSLFQASTNGADVADTRSVSESERSANHKPNGSYKILNRFVKPFVTKRVGFVFPGLTSRAGNNLVIPDECKKIGICEDIPNYPEDLVKNLAQELEKNNISKFNKDVLDIPQIAERIGPEEENIELCNSVQKLYAPRAAQDANKEWFVIMNDKVKPQQTFRVEICQTRDSPCSAVAYFQNGYEARCVQKYMLRQMVALNEQNEVVQRPFQVPSCCSCVVKVV
ncbi:protein spaetzle-like isoform X1 [Vanessa atalanta]|uniref:protein spaetzle-like isoform X1 n=1 Tax=Vanessa atalanta TaxID=42275 RepID=UPI001FCD74F7|nr:protein spaetzle-like isoform X1 [Vanessa atalanta]